MKYPYGCGQGATNQTLPILCSKDSHVFAGRARTNPSSDEFLLPIECLTIFGLLQTGDLSPNL